MSETRIIPNAFLNPNTFEIIEEKPAPLFKYLVFEGGGVRGSAYSGVIGILENAKILSGIQHVSGTSIGAITAMLVALGYSASEIHNALHSLVFKDFLEGKKPWSFTPEFISKGMQYLSILSNEGFSISSGTLLLDWLEDRIEKKLGKREATFADLEHYVKTQAVNGKYKYLSVVSTNLSNDRDEVFNHLTTPHLSIAQAIRMSAAFPGVFKAIEWDNGQSLDLYVDGGLKKNLPADIFDEETYLPEGYDFTHQGKKKWKNPATLAIKIDTDEELFRAWRMGQAKPIRTFKEFSRAIFNSMLNRDSEMYEAYGMNLILVYDNGVDTLKFDITEREKEELVKCGIQATLDYLHSHFARVYDYKIYKNELHWLSAKKIEEVNEIKKIYEGMLKEKKDDVALKEKVNWLNDYLQFRFNCLLDPSTPCGLTAPSQHIDYANPSPCKEIDDGIRADIKYKIQLIDTELATLSEKIKEVEAKFENVFIQLHDSINYGLVTYLSKFKEKFKILNDLKRDFQNKLNVKIEKKSLNPWMPKIVALQEECQKDIREKYASSLPHAKLLNELHNHLMNRSAFLKNNDGIEMMYDLKDEEDMKIYLMGCMLYFKYTNHFPILQNKIAPLYEACFANADIPKNFNELKAQLKLEKIELLSAAYKIESLIGYFIKKDKPIESASSVNLDHILLELSAQKKKLPVKKAKKLENEVELDFIYHSSAFNSTDNFLMFYRPDKLNDREQVAEENFIKEVEDRKKVPKCMRRF